MNLTIKQSTNSTENLSSSNVVETLYQLFVSGLPVADAVLVGRIQVPAAYEDSVDFLNTQFSAEQDNGSDFQVTVLNNNYYIRFSDSEVERVLLEKAVAQGIIQQGEGLTITTIGQVSLGNDLFYKNSIIVNFDEVKYCNLHAGAIVRQASNIESVDLTDITYLGNWFAGNCPKLEWFHGFRKGEKGVLHLDKLTEMGSGGTGCFCGCPGLIRVTSMGTVSVLKGVFGGSVNLESVVIPSQCSEVSDTFNGCTKLSTINISQLRKISGSFCKNCTNLEYLDGPDSAQGELYLPFLTGTLYKEAFYNCTKITNVSSLGAITTIGESAFNNCVNLATISFPNTLTTIERNALNGTAWYNAQQPSGGPIIINQTIFYKYKGPVSGAYSVPANILSISQDAFREDESLTSIVIPSSVVEIGSYAFFKTKNLISITVDNNNVKYDSRDNCNAIIEKSTNKMIVACKNTTIPSGVVELAERLFQESSIESLVVTEGVQKIGNYAFNGARQLTYLDLPSTLTNLGCVIFKDCTSLQTFICRAIVPPTFAPGGQYFSGTGTCPIYVPSGSVEAYKSASVWSSLASRIQAIPT